MFRPRVIPVLLLKNKGLFKSIKFNQYKYIGDPINAVKIFNDLKADELVFLDILATNENRKISLDFVRTVGEEANMPFAVGGGIRTIEDIREILHEGAEKVVINSQAIKNPDFIKNAADTFGSSTIVVCIDAKKKLLGGYQVYTHSGTKNTHLSVDESSRYMQELGAGELIIQSVSHDGMMSGYDLELIKLISCAVTIPVVALGGAGSISDIEKVIVESKASAAAAGSMFVYHGPRHGVLINYPTQRELNKITIY